ncbi:zinc-dependent metalloprotease [Solitalea longa]|nr:zinc-dependent metalloprotease [Solitalea longa]
MKLKYILMVAIGLCASTAMAQEKGKDKKKAKDKASVAKVDSVKTPVKPYEQYTKGTVAKKGLFNIYKKGDKYYFEIPDSIINRQLMVTSYLVKVPGGSPKFGGEEMNTTVMTFEKGKANKLLLRVIYNVLRADSTDAVSKAVKNSTINPIVAVYDIKARGEADKSSIIDFTDFFEKENVFTTLNNEAKSGMQVSAMVADRSYIKSFATYPINVEMKMVRTYNAASTPGKGPGGRPVPPLEAGKIGGAATLELSTSILLMPEKAMTPRYYDTRVGYFADGLYDYADGQQQVSPKVYIVRYRLEPKDEDIEKYKRGELVEPKNPIVYYIDPATPKQWRPYLIQGVNDWNKAFESAGFKNAIMGKEWPENDTTMSLEDARYKVIRYLPSETPNAYGPNIHDPRSGEILQSYVGWYHNVMTLVHDWYMVQASPNDPRARTMKFSDELMGQLIRFVSSHELGHTLGLRHNMGSSSLTPVEKLRDKEWVEKHGHCNSIMDYARFNYVAQPEDKIAPEGIMPRINDYDKWAIQWGYKQTFAKDEEEDKKIVSQWIVDSLKANPRLWFGGEGMNNDCRAQTEDVGDNSMVASTYGIKNLKIVMKNLPEWTKEENDLYTNLSQMYRQVAGQYLRYANHVAKNIASVEETISTPEQPGNGDVYASTSVAKQKEAVAFLNKEVFETPYWLLDNNILNKISKPVGLGSVPVIQDRVMDQVFSDRVFNTLNTMEQRYGKANTYSLNSLLNDVKVGVWSELKTNKPIDIYRRGVQKSYVSALLMRINEAELGANAMAGMLGGNMAREMMPMTLNSDVGSVVGLHLENLRKEILAALPLAKDKASKDHLQYVADQIQSGLKKRFALAN